MLKITNAVSKFFFLVTFLFPMVSLFNMCMEFEDFTKWQTNGTCTIFFIPKPYNMLLGVLVQHAQGFFKCNFR